ncbi:MAG: transglycosylase SLT domain-containing protein [bacterium]
MRSIIIVAWAGLLLSSGIAQGRTLTPGGSGDVLFPVPVGIRENVNFWRDVFSRYKISDVAYHDEVHLNRVYEVSNLGRPWSSDRSQKRRIRRRERKIKAILSALAYGRTPPSGEGRLVARIRKMFAGQPRSEIRRAISRIRAQPGLKERFRDGYIRSGRYLPHFRRIFRKYGLPEDLTLLPHVESGFRESIYSHAGASGMWQFTRATGRFFMRVDRTIDGRRDPYISADAAARLFKRNYEDLKTWPLAITAYNHGEMGMRRAVRQVGSRDIGVIAKRYNGRTFGFASRNFYAEFLAAVHVHKNAKAYFGNLRPDPPARFAVFHLPGYTRLGELSRRIGIDRKILRKMNPALRSSVLRGRRRIPRGYPLRVPSSEVARVRQAYFQNSSEAVASKRDENFKWVWIRSGDSLGRIARRFRVSLKELMAENDLEGSRIVVGDRLRIPKKGGSRKLKITASKNPLVPSEKNRKKALKSVQVAKLTDSAKPKRKMKMKVSRSRTNRSTESSLRGQRSLPVGPPVPQKEEDSWVAQGLDVALDIPERGSRLRKDALRQVLAVRSSPSGKVGWVQVQENETIGHFSRWLRISPRVIRRMNKIRSNRRVRLGKRIRVPLRRVSKKNLLEKRVSFHISIQENFLRKYSVTRTDRHKLKRGENVWTLVMRIYKVPLWLFQKYNSKKDLHKISVGEELVVPILEPRSF